MGTLRLEYFAESKDNKNIYGKCQGDHDDSTTSGTEETHEIPSGSYMMRARSISGAHHVAFGTGGTASGFKVYVAEGEVVDLEIPTAFNTGVSSYKTA